MRFGFFFFGGGFGFADTLGSSASGTEAGLFVTGGGNRFNSAISGSGSGSDAEKPGTDNKKSEDDKKSEDEDKPEDEEKPADGAQEEVKSGSFRDVTSAHWAFASVERAAELGLVTGYSDGTFRPDTAVTRAQFVLMLWRMCGKPAAAKAASFADASADWYQDALSWAVEKGYVNGLSDTRFGPDAPITRQQAMASQPRISMPSSTCKK